MKDPFESLKGKKVLVTGGSTGIGAAMTELFARRGARVGIHCNRSRSEARALKDKIANFGGQAEVFSADLRLKREYGRLLPSFVRRFGGIDVLVNNAGAVLGAKHFYRLDERSWDETFAVNAKAAFFLSQDTFRRMKGGGKIINISSVAVKYGGSEESVHYAAAKAALESLTLSLARFGARHKILVNCIRGGFIDTGFHKKIGRSSADIRKRVSLIPLGRAGRPEEIAQLALFLASSAGDFITGQIISVSGGD